MKFSAQEEYGLRCLLAIAGAGPDGSVTISEISGAEGLTISHVAKLLGILRKAGYVKSTRGQNGGYFLSVDPAKTMLVTVLGSLGGPLFGPDFCDRHSGLLADCSHGVDCQVRPLWIRVQKAVDAALDGLTLADLMDGRIASAPVVFYQKPGTPMGRPTQ